MRLKSFYGPTMTDAMRLVREALGDNAIIVATRDDEMGGVRVTAAIDEPLAQSQNMMPPTVPDDPGSEAIEVIASAFVQNMVPAALAEKLLATATQFASEDPLLALGAALDTHYRYSVVADDVAERPILFVGPPGAGKTLSVAKFATKATLAKKKIALMSTDTERAGGMAQLGAFARLLNTDMIEIEDAHALQDAIAIQAKDTIVLIDTAGCNPFDASDRQSLAAFIKAAKATVVLVFPADMDACEASDMAKEFANLGASHLLITRVDMVRRVGGLLHYAYESKIPLTHFSATTKVTEAPQPFNPVSLGRLVLPKTAQKPSKAAGTA